MNLYNHLIVLFVSLGSVTYGFSLAVIGSVLGLESFLSYFDLDFTSSKSASITGATSGLFAGGCAVGALLTTFLADRLGRMRTIQWTCVLCIVSSAVQGGSVHIAMFLVGRFFNGVGVGLMLALVPLYQCEIAPAQVRGQMVSSHGLLIVTGHALAAWTGYGCYFSPNPAFQWRFELSAQAISPLLLLLGTPWIPESPRWLAERDRESEALAVLEKLHPDDGSGLVARKELTQVAQQIALDRQMYEQTGRFPLLTVPSYRKRLLLGCLTQFLCQSTGVLVVNNYQVMLYNGLGLYRSIPLLLYACYLTWAAFMNFWASRIMDKVGRTRLLISGLCGCSVAIICEMAMVAKFSGTSDRVGNGFGVFFLFFYVTIYGLCLDATCYVYCVEIFPTHIRAMGTGISMFTQACATLIYTQSAPAAFGNVGWRYYFVFFLVPLAGVPFVWKFFPETKGATLEEIGEAFGEKVAAPTTNLDGFEVKPGNTDSECGVEKLV
ncbi:general substrate transporter [Aspergillus pseudoustus]|uniref:General substrate transporter n=1 Tax=Aspergillus pseudoustus TaxID=1810923 RepID=A0ABR4KKX9_9EURO